ncbi:MAG: hypothetical protein WAZ12_02170 [Candidatus Absconditicoccaceae bacterium]
MVAKDWFSEREKEKEDRADLEFDNKLSILFDKLKSKLVPQEDKIIESIIVNAQKETGKLSYDGRTKAIKSFENDELMKYAQELDMDGIYLNRIISEYSFYIKKKILGDFPEYEMRNIIPPYDQFLLQEDEIREKFKKDLEKLPSNVSSIDLFVNLINCDKKRKKGIKNLLSLDCGVTLKQEKEILEEITRERLKESLSAPSPKEKLIKSLGKDILNEFKDSLEKEKKLGQFISLFDLIEYCTNKVNKKYNLRFSEEEKDILIEIGQNHLKKVKYK